MISVPEGPAWRVDFDALDAKFDWVRALRGVPQDPVHHAEGDVSIHTRMVLEALSGMPAWRALDAEVREIVFVASLLHDVAKPLCTRVDAEGRITSRGHSARGALFARRILWRLGTPLSTGFARASAARRPSRPRVARVSSRSSRTLRAARRSRR